MAPWARFISLIWLQWECTKMSVSSERMEEEMLSNLSSSSAELRTKKTVLCGNVYMASYRRERGNQLWGKTLRPGHPAKCLPCDCVGWVWVVVSAEREMACVNWVLQGRDGSSHLGHGSPEHGPWSQIRWPRTTTEWGGNRLSGSHGQLDRRCWGRDPVPRLKCLACSCCP